MCICIYCIMNEELQVLVVILTGLCSTSGLGNTFFCLTQIHLGSPVFQHPALKSSQVHLISGLSICRGHAVV